MHPLLAGIYELGEPQSRGGSQSWEVLPWAAEWRRIQAQSEPFLHLIVGAPGSGKSVLAAATAMEMARAGAGHLIREAPLHELILPVWIDLSTTTAEELLVPAPTAIVQAVSRTLGRTVSGVVASWLLKAAQRGQVWLFLDGFDSAPCGAHGLCKWFGELQEHGCRLLVTCRTAHQHTVSGRAVARYQLAPFRKHEQALLIARWFDGRAGQARALLDLLQRSHAFSELCRVPLMLTLACLKEETVASGPSTTRVKLLEHALACWIGGEWLQGAPNGGASETRALMPLFEKVIPALFDEAPGNNWFQRARVTELTALASGCAQPQAHILIEGLLSTGLWIRVTLGDSGEEHVGFCHRTILEYVRARALNTELLAPGAWMNPKLDAATERVLDWVERKAWRLEYWGVISQLAGMAEDASPLLSRLADDTLDDSFKHRLTLALLCVAELPPERRALAPAIARKAITAWWHFAYTSQKLVLAHLESSLPIVAEVDPEWRDGQRVTEWLANALNGSSDWHLNEAIRALGTLRGELKRVARVSVSYPEPELIGRFSRIRFAHQPGLMATAPPTGVEPLFSRVMYLGPAAEEIVPELVAAMNDWPELVSSGAKACASLGEVARSAVPALIARLELTDGTTWELTHALAEMSDEAAVVSEALVRRLGSETGATHALGRLGPTAWRAVPYLLQRLKTSRLDAERREIATTLAEIGGTAKAAVPELVTLMANPDAAVRFDAAEALGRFGGAAKQATSALTRGLRDENWHVRMYSAQSLGLIGVANRAVVGSLIKALADRDSLVQSSVARALNRLKQPRAVHHLARRLSGSDSEASLEAINLLRKFTELAPEVASVLMENSRDALRRLREPGGPEAVSAGDSELVLHTAIALGDLRWDGAVQLLIDVYPLSKGYSRARVAKALAGFGAAAKAAVPVLLTSLRDDDDHDDHEVRTAVIGALGHVSDGSPEVVSALVARLEDAAVCEQAAEALGMIGIATKAAAPNLLAMLKEETRGIGLALWRQGVAGVRIMPGGGAFTTEELAEREGHRLPDSPPADF